MGYMYQFLDHTQSMMYEQWLAYLEKIALPVLTGFAEKTLTSDLCVEFGPNRKSINTDQCAHIELFCRTILGAAPVLNPSLPSAYPQFAERYERLKMLTTYAIESAFDGYLVWECGDQLLVEAALLCYAFLRYPYVYGLCSNNTQNAILTMLRKAYSYPPHVNNWLLFSCTVGLFLYRQTDVPGLRGIQAHLTTLESWYIGDGWYKDGVFHMDYYNSYIIYPMLLEVLRNLKQAGHATVIKRAQRHCEFLERLISCDGSFPFFGRSAVYRCAAFHCLSNIACRNELPSGLEYGGVRCALAAMLAQFFEGCQNFTERGFLTLGFNGKQPMLADTYSNTGSTYFALVVFEPLGLPPTHAFWSAPDAPWTQVRLWNGGAVLKDFAK
jgi:hypothetical protein